MWHCGVDVAYPWLSDWTCLQWALCSLIFGIWHRNTQNGLLCEGKIESFYLDEAEL